MLFPCCRPGWGEIKKVWPASRRRGELLDIKFEGGVQSNKLDSMGVYTEIQYAEMHAIAPPLPPVVGSKNRASKRKR